MSIPQKPPAKVRVRRKRYQQLQRTTEKEKNPEKLPKGGIIPKEVK